MDTVSDATRRLQADGYTGNWYAAEDHTLRCGESAELLDPATVQIDHILRFEGQSDPGDEVILFALQTPGGARGIYSAAYGAETAAVDADVISRMRHRTGDGTLDASPDTAPTRGSADD